MADWGEGKSDADGANSTAPGGGGAPATTGDATWLDRFFGTSPAARWTKAGGDFNATASATTSVNGIGTYKWSSAALTSDVQKWLDNPQSNFGWMVRNANEASSQTARRIDSRESSTITNRPQLTIDFTPATGTTSSVTAAVTPANVLENSGTNLVYTLTRTGDLADPLTVNFAVSGTAKFTDDYTATGAVTFTGTTGTATFGAGAATALVTVSPVGDTIVEPDETVSLTVINGPGYTAGATAAATGTLTNDDVSAGTKLVLGDTPVSFKAKSKPILLLPNLVVDDGQQGASSLSGGQIILTINAATSTKGKSTKTTDKIGIPKLSAIGKKGSQVITPGQMILTLNLSSKATAAKVQTFLRGITFTTSGIGLDQPTRDLHVELKSPAGEITDVTQIVNVSK